MLSVSTEAVRGTCSRGAHHTVLPPLVADPGAGRRAQADRVICNTTPGVTIIEVLNIEVPCL